MMLPGARVNAIVLPSGPAFASSIAWRSDPVPLSSVVLTVYVANTPCQLAWSS